MGCAAGYDLQFPLLEESVSLGCKNKVTVNPLMVMVVLGHSDKPRIPRLDPRGLRESERMAAS